jgi:CyaY protein
VQGGFFLRKKPLGILLSLYTNWKNALKRTILPAVPTCYTEAMMDEHEFRNRAEQALEALKQHLFAREDQSGEFETDEQNGVLQVLFEEPAAKFVFTPNAPVQQIWISALISSYKLDWSPETEDFQLPATKEGLIPLVDRLIDIQLKS